LNPSSCRRWYGRIPSIRNDIPKYERRSIADSQNYGDDVNAAYLLHPSQFASQGVEDEEFTKPREKVSSVPGEGT
jgi:EF-hand domain-containing family member B